MSNPYQSPSAPQGQGGPEEHATGTVYSGQKLLIYSILGYFIAMPFLVGANAFLEGPVEQPVAGPMFALVLVGGLLIAFGSAVCASIGIFRMGAVLYPGSTRYLYAIGVLIPAPIVGLIVMLVANSNANGYLKARGYKIGFLGAKTKR